MIHEVWMYSSDRVVTTGDTICVFLIIYQTIKT